MLAKNFESNLANQQTRMLFNTEWYWNLRHNIRRCTIYFELVAKKTRIISDSFNLNTPNAFQNHWQTTIYYSPINTHSHPFSLQYISPYIYLYPLYHSSSMCIPIHCPCNISVNLYLFPSIILVSGDTQPHRKVWRR